MSFRRFGAAAAVGAISLLSSYGHAAGPESTMSPGAYMQLSFGSTAKPSLMAGLALSYRNDNVYPAGQVPQLASLGFDELGLREVRMGGVPVAYRSVSIPVTDNGEVPVDEQRSWSREHWAVIGLSALGIAGTVAALSGGSGGNSDNSDKAGPEAQVDGRGPGGFGCANGKCAVPCGSGNGVDACSTGG